MTFKSSREPPMFQNTILILSELLFWVLLFLLIAVPVIFLAALLGVGFLLAKYAFMFTAGML